MDTVLRGAAVYFALLLVTRLTGRRSLSQSTVFDVVLLLVIAETVQNALVGEDGSLVSAAVLVVTLALIDIALAWAKARWHAVGNVLDGTPTVLVSGGRPDARALRRARVDLDDVMQAARQSHGLRTLAEVDAAVLEVDGAISIIPRQR